MLSQASPGFAFTGGRPVTDADVAVGSGVGSTAVAGWGRIAGYRVEFSSRDGRRLRDWAALYATSSGAAEALLSEAAGASAGLVEKPPPVVLGQETHFFTSPAGASAGTRESALAWREGNLDAVIYGSGTTVPALIARAGEQETLLRAAVAKETEAATLTTTSIPAAGKNDFQPWIPIAIGAVLVGGVAVARRRRRR